MELNTSKMSVFGEAGLYVEELEKYLIMPKNKIPNKSPQGHCVQQVFETYCWMVSKINCLASRLATKMLNIEVAIVEEHFTK